jgi:hypothetical protein
MAGTEVLGSQDIKLTESGASCRIASTDRGGNYSCITRENRNHDFVVVVLSFLWLSSVSEIGEMSRLIV